MMATCNHAGGSCSCGIGAPLRPATMTRVEAAARMPDDGPMVPAMLQPNETVLPRTGISGPFVDAMRRYATPDVKGLTDDALRAECERRGIVDPKLGERYELALKERFEIVANRDEWKRRACGYAVELALLRERCAAAEAHNERRGDWLQEITETCERHGMPRGETADKAIEWLSIRLHTLRVMSLRGHDDCSATRGESGPGIAATRPAPDNSIAHLDEDLLCDDA